MTAQQVLEYALTAWPTEDSDEEVNGGDMVEWFYSEFLPMARRAIDAERGRKLIEDLHNETTISN